MWGAGGGGVGARSESGIGMVQKENLKFVGKIFFLDNAE